MRITCLFLSLTQVMMFFSCADSNAVSGWVEKRSSEWRFLVDEEKSFKEAFNDAKGDTMSACRIINYLPAGYVKNGSVDYTSYIQQAVDGHQCIFFPSFPLMINEKGLNIGSNKKIVFEKGSSIVLKASEKSNYDILNLRGSKNVFLFNPVIVGDRKSHLSAKGEWGMGIGIYACQNIKVFNPTITDTWGDGIYIGANERTHIASSEIYIEDAHISNARRNGISITSAKSVTIVNAEIQNSNGTLPMDGIDVEPNSPFDEISDINLINPLTEYNKGYGIEFSLSKMYGGPTKRIDAVISGHRDNGSKSAAYISCDSRRSINGEKITGIITFQKPKWRNMGEYVWRPYGLQENELILSVINPSLFDAQGTLISGAQTRKILWAEVFPHSQVEVVTLPD